MSELSESEKAVFKYLLDNTKFDSSIAQTNTGNHLRITDIALQLGISTISTIRTIINLNRKRLVVPVKTSQGYVLIACKDFIPDNTTRNLFKTTGIDNKTLS